jgi:hypothetical protein
MRSRSFFGLVISAVFTLSLVLSPLAPGRLSTAAAETVPVLKSLSSQAPAPNASLTVTGTNFGAISTWTVVIELPGGEKFEQPVANPTATTFSITVPNIYTGYNVTAKNAAHRTRIQQIKQLYVKKGTLASNRLPLNIVSPYPILDQYGKKPAMVGDTIIVNGGNWVSSLLTAPGMYWAVFEYLPGKTFKTVLLPPPVPAPPVPVPFMPNYGLVGMFQTKVPDVYAGKTPAEQALISGYMGKLTIYGSMLGQGFTSNALDIMIVKKQESAPSSPNPCKVPLAAYYSPNSPDRTMVYRGASNVAMTAPQKAVVAGVKNTCAYKIQLSLKDKYGAILLGGVWLNPGEVTGAFDGRDATASWEAMGPESGSYLGKFPSVSIEVSWN